MNLIDIVNDSFKNEQVASYPKFKAGDTITVTYRIKEGDKERLQKSGEKKGKDCNPLEMPLFHPHN